MKFNIIVKGDNNEHLFTLDEFEVKEGYRVAPKIITEREEVIISVTVKKKK